MLRLPDRRTVACSTSERPTVATTGIGSLSRLRQHYPGLCAHLTGALPGESLTRSGHDRHWAHAA